MNNFTPEQLKQITEQLLPELRKQVLDELKDEEARKLEEQKIRREQEAKAIDAYAETMKNSPEPWIDIRAHSREPDGRLKLQLDWNDAFIQECKLNGLSGTSDEQIVQKYLSLLAHNVDQQLAEESNTDTPFE